MKSVQISERMTIPETDGVNIFSVKFRLGKNKKCSYITFAGCIAYNEAMCRFSECIESNPNDRVIVGADFNLPFVSWMVDDVWSVLFPVNVDSE